MRVLPNRKERELYLHRRIQPLLWLCLSCAIIATVNRLVLGNWEVCLFRMLTGFPCPGCGLTHAAVSLLHGDFHKSVQYHLFLIPVLLFILPSVLPANYQAIQNWLYIHHKRFCGGFFALFFCYYFLRLLLYFPGNYPLCYKTENYLHLAKVAVLKIMELFHSRPIFL